MWTCLPWGGFLALTLVSWCSRDVYWLPPVGSPAGWASSAFSFCRVILLLPLSFQSWNGSSFLRFLISVLPHPPQLASQPLCYLGNQLPAFHSLTNSNKTEGMWVWKAMWPSANNINFPFSSCKMEVMVSTPGAGLLMKQADINEEPGPLPPSFQEYNKSYSTPFFFSGINLIVVNYETIKWIWEVSKGLRFHFLRL